MSEAAEGKWVLRLHLGDRVHTVECKGDYDAARARARRYVQEGFEEAHGPETCTIHTVAAVDVMPFQAKGRSPTRVESPWGV